MINNKIDAKSYEDSMIGHLGIVFYESEKEDEVKATMPVNSHTCQPFGYLNGGASLALAECVAGHGSNLLCEPGTYAVGAQVSANHISSVPVGQTVTAIGKIIHKGKSSHVWNVDIVSEYGKLVSSARIINFVCHK